MVHVIFTYGIGGKKRAGSDHSFWARVRIEDLKYSQDSCSELFSKSPELHSQEARSIHHLCEKLSDDPDEVLSALNISPEVVFHGGCVFSMNNRRAYCIKNCAAPKGARIWVQLYHSPDEYDKAHGHGAFDKYYSTTSGGENITVTKHHHKGNLARTFNVEKVCEAHIDFNHANAADEVCADKGILTEQFHLLGIEKRSKFQIVVYGTLQRDVDRAGAFIQGKYDKEVPLSKRCRPGLNAVPSCRPDVHEGFAASSHLDYPGTFYIGTAKKRNKFQYVCTDRMSNGCPVYEDKQNGLVVFKEEDDYWYANGRKGKQLRFRTIEDPRLDGAHDWEQSSKRGWIPFGEYLTTCGNNLTFT